MVTSELILPSRPQGLDRGAYQTDTEAHEQAAGCLGRCGVGLPGLDKADLVYVRNRDDQCLTTGWFTK